MSSTKTTTSVLIVAVILPFLLSATPVSAQSAPPAQSPTCSVSSTASDVAEFTGVIIAQGAGLFAASTLTDFLSGLPVVGGAFKGVSDLIGYIFQKWVGAVIFGVIASAAVWLSGLLLQFAIAMNTNLLTSNAVVHAAYGISLGLVNMIIVLAIIATAFGVMLRSQKWGAKNLSKIIIVALLVNFSLFIAGSIVDVGTSATQSMAASVCGGNFVSKFNIATIYNNLSGAFSGGSLATRALASYANVFLAAFITLIAALTLLAVTVFLVARFVVLTILLGIAPIAWIGFMLPGINVPGLGNAWSGWWDKFLKWVFFGPIMLFFLWLTSVLLQWLGSGEAAQIMAAGGLAAGLGQIVAVVIMMLGGLYVAFKAGGGIATVAIAGAGFGALAIGKAANRVQSAAALRANLLLSKGPPEGAVGRILHKGQIGLLQNVARSVSVQKDIGKLVSGVGVKLPEGAKIGAELIDEKAFDKESTASILNRFAGFRGAELVSVLSVLNKRGDLSKVPADRYMNGHTKSLFTAYNKSFGDVEKGAAATLAAWSAFNGGDATKDLAEEEMKKFYLGLTDKDRAKMPFNGVYGDYDSKNPFLGMSADDLKRFRSVTTKGILANPGELNKVAPKLKAQNFDNLFEAVVKEAIPDHEIEGKIVKDMAKNELVKFRKQIMAELKEKREDIHKAFSKTLARHETGLDVGEEEEEKKEESAPEEKLTEKK